MLGAVDIWCFSSSCVLRDTVALRARVAVGALLLLLATRGRLVWGARTAAHVLQSRTLYSLFFVTAHFRVLRVYRLGTENEWGLTSHCCDYG